MNDDAKTAPLHVARLDGMPKYLLLRNALVEAVTSGRWAPGERIPSEDTLVEMSGFSLGTVQRSLRILVDENRLVRRHGTGTFVATEVATPMKAPFQHCRFMDDATGEVLPIYVKVVQRRPDDSDGPWVAHLPAGRTFCIERLFSINNEFTLYTHLYFNQDKFPGLVELDLDALSHINVKDMLSREFHHPLARFAEKLCIRQFPDEICNAIQIKRGTSGGVMEILAYDREGEGVYFQDLFIPPNQRRLLVVP